VPEGGTPADSAWRKRSNAPEAAWTWAYVSGVQCSTTPSTPVLRATSKAKRASLAAVTSEYWNSWLRRRPPGATASWPDYDDRPDFELEVAAVVGRSSRDVPPEEGKEYIVGYTVFNDFAARDIQAREMQARLGPAKGKDFANRFGPYPVTPDEFDPETAPVEPSGQS
jgi:2-keto-4-pentenoate hydratase/2-oxohepta-3-ene-1,7-dioic acid hydratase in catechol pathway